MALSHNAQRQLAKALLPFEEMVASSTSPEEVEAAQAALAAARVAHTARLVRADLQDATARAYLKARQDQEAVVIREGIRVGDWDLLRERGGLYVEGMQETSDLIKELQGRMKHTNGNGGCMHTHYFVTVNVKPDVTIHELRKCVERYAKSTMIRSVTWVYEQRGAIPEEAGKGLHSHILVEQRGDVFDGKFKQSTRRTFEKLVGSPQTHVDIRGCKAEWVEDKLAYMRGEKTEPGKADKVAVDTVWRQRNNLRPMYQQQNGTKAPPPRSLRKTHEAQEVRFDAPGSSWASESEMESQADDMD